MEGMTKAEVDRMERGTIAHSSQPMRPRDAATLILLERQGDEVLVLMGRRHAGHAFMDSTKESYRREADEASWPRTLDFLTRHLGG